MTAPQLVLLLDFDGTLYLGDLPIQAYARHASAHLRAEHSAAFIDGLRGFLEGKSIGRSTVDLTPAQDGYHAVELLAAAAGVPTGQVKAAYRQSRLDLAASAFAVDAPKGLVELLTALHDVAHVAVVTNADPPGVAEVLAAIGVADLVDEMVTAADKPAGMPAIVARLVGRLHPAGDAPDRLVAVGDRWASDLAEAHRIGARTAYVDRFGRGDGRPTWRARTLAELLPELAAWATARIEISI